MVLWVQSRIRCELANPPMVQLSIQYSGSAAAPLSTAAINVLRSERGRQKVSVRYGREPFLLSCIFYRSVLLSGQDPSNWTAPSMRSVCLH